MIDEEIDVYDVAAIRPIIEEAGGRFTDLEGTPTHRSSNTLASNGLMHDAVLELVASQGNPWAPTKSVGSSHEVDAVAGVVG